MSSFWQSAPSIICVDVTLIHKAKYTFVWQAATFVGQEIHVARLYARLKDQEY